MRCICDVEPCDANIPVRERPTTCPCRTGMSDPHGSMSSPKIAPPGSKSFLRRNIGSAMERASGPARRTTPTPPRPGGVAIATIVSSRFNEIIVCEWSRTLGVVKTRSPKYNQAFAYGGRPSWSDHSEHRSRQRKDDRGHGDGFARGGARHARAHAAIPEGLVALRRARCRKGVRGQVRHETNGPRICEGRRG